MPNISEHAENIPEDEDTLFLLERESEKCPKFKNMLRTYPRLRIHSFYKNVRLKIVQHL